MFKVPLKTHAIKYKFDSFDLTITPFEFRYESIHKGATYSGIVSSGTAQLSPDYYSKFSNYQGWKIEIYNSSKILYDVKYYAATYDEFGRIISTNDNTFNEFTDVKPGWQHEAILYSNKSKATLNSIVLLERDKSHNSKILKSYNDLNISLPFYNYSKVPLLLSLILTFATSIFAIFLFNSYGETRYLLLSVLTCFVSFITLGGALFKKLYLVVPTIICVLSGLMAIAGLIPIIWLISSLYFLYIIAQRRISFKDLFQKSTPTYEGYVWSI